MYNDLVIEVADLVIDEHYYKMVDHLSMHNDFLFPMQIHFKNYTQVKIWAIGRGGINSNL